MSSRLSTIILCALAMIVEGFDTYAIGYAGQTIAREWHLSQSVIGDLYAVGVAASLLGSVIFGMLADRFGRKGLLILSSIIFGISTLLSAVAPSLPLLILSRALAGIGLGASVPCAMALATEAASEHRRSSVPVLLSSAIGSGSLVASLASAAIMPSYGWRGLFVLGGLMPLLIAAAMPRLMGESTALPRNPAARVPWHEMLGRDMALLTIMVTLALFAAYVVEFFMGFWLPSLVRTATTDVRTIGLAMTAIKTASLAGGLVMAGAAVKFGLRRTLPIAFILAGIATATLIGKYDSLLGITTSLAAASFFIDGSFGGIIGLGAIVFPSRLRATGIGLTIGVGRLFGGTLGPMAGGVLIDQGLSLRGIGMACSVPLLLSALLVWLTARMKTAN